MATDVYRVQQQYDKARPNLLRAEHRDESLYGADSPNVMMQFWTLCDMYDQGGTARQSQPETLD